MVRFVIFHFQAYSRKIRGGRPSDELIYIIFLKLTPVHFEILALSVVDGTPYHFGEIHPCRLVVVMEFEGIPKQTIYCYVQGELWLDFVALFLFPIHVNSCYD